MSHSSLKLFFLLPLLLLLLFPLLQFSFHSSVCVLFIDSLSSLSPAFIKFHLLCLSKIPFWWVFGFNIVCFTSRISVWFFFGFTSLLKLPIHSLITYVTFLFEEFYPIDLRNTFLIVLKFSSSNSNIWVICSSLTTSHF